MSYSPQTHIDLPETSPGSTGAPRNLLEAGIAAADASYVPQAWVDLPTLSPGSMAARRNHIEAGIAAIDGTYMQQTWTDLPVVSPGSLAARLNHIEVGVGALTPGGSSDWEVVMNYGLVANGPHPSTITSGQTPRLTWLPAAVGAPTVSGGYSVMVFNSGTSAADYVTVAVPGEARQARASSKNGLGLVLWTNNMPAGELTVFEQYAIAHMAFLTTGWQFGIWNNSPVSVIASRTYGTPFSADTVQNVGLRVNRATNTVTVIDAEGIVTDVVHSFIGTKAANYVCAEHYYSNAATPDRTKIASFGATTNVYVPPPDVIAGYEFTEEFFYNAVGGARDLAGEGFTRLTYSSVAFIVDASGVVANTSLPRVHNAYYRTAALTGATAMWCGTEISILPSSTTTFGPACAFVQSATPFRGIFCELYGAKSWLIAWGPTASADSTFPNVLASGDLPTNHQVGDKLRALWDQSTGLIKFWRIRGTAVQECGTGATYPNGDATGFNRVAIGLPQFESGRVANLRGGIWTAI